MNQNRQEPQQQPQQLTQEVTHSKTRDAWIVTIGAVLGALITGLFGPLIKDWAFPTDTVALSRHLSQVTDERDDLRLKYNTVLKELETKDQQLQTMQTMFDTSVVGMQAQNAKIVEQNELIQKTILEQPESLIYENLTLKQKLNAATTEVERYRQAEADREQANRQATEEAAAEAAQRAESERLAREEAHRKSEAEAAQLRRYNNRFH